MIFTVNKAPATIFCLFLALSAFLCSARDTITRKNPISANEKETLVSAERIFELGFFTPDVASDNRTYLGIWYYNLNARTVVWVANRDRPLLGSPGSLEIDENGNLRVSNATTNLWSISLASSSTSRTLKLTDSGNLVLSNDDQPENSLWESFNHPTDTFLPGMKMEGSLPLTSWIHEGDPRRGKFEFSLSQGERNIYVISRDINGTCRIPDRPDRIKDVPSYISELLLNFNSSSKSGSRLVMNYTGRVEYLNLNIDYWNLMWWGPGKCSIANKCGNFSSCNASNRIECKCLPRFKPSNSKNWNSGLFSDGCTRNSTCLPNDTFLTLKMMVVGKPNSKILVENEGECSVYCRTDCQCEAYSYVVATSKQGSNNNRCWIWTEPVSDLQEDYENSGQNLFVRVANSEIGDLQKGSTGNALHSLNLMLPLIIVFILACAITSTYLWRKKRANRQGHKRSGKRNRALRSLDSERHVKELIGSVGFQEEDGESIDVPFFEMESILAATDNFSNENKLGQGGYGPVYKGTFPGGKEIAIKRLSSVTGQGLQEFKSEVVLIAKLQHRNLVKLQGYCVKEEEKILLYEYMPNKSLDSFLFGQQLNMLLDWNLRVHIILGIARGLLYLHHDSRLRIIHRDLKTSNILLDYEMNPKISDFGLARMVEGKEIGANTTKVVGTYGYMSPEYAMEGLFSIKSDVFSFGVVLLEIVAGKKNTGFYQSELALSLVGYTWRLWTENKVLDLVDPALHEACNAEQFVKFVNVGLLCVQEDPNDRPTMSNVVTMLDSEAATLPTPKQPAFVPRPALSGAASSSSRPYTSVEITSTLEETA